MPAMTNTQARPTAMAMHRAHARQRIWDLGDIINEHLIKLLATDVSDRTRAAWRKELRAWFGKVADIGLKPDGRPPKERDLYKWLWDDFFGQVEERNIERQLQELADFRRNNLTPAEIARQMEAFHRAAAAHLARGEPVGELIEELGRA
jgi:hypothetical protein